MPEDRDWGLFKQKLKARTEIDLDLYKEPQMKRRINNLIMCVRTRMSSQRLSNI